MTENRIWENLSPELKTLMRKAYGYATEEWYLHNVTGVHRHIIDMESYRHLNFQVELMLTGGTGTLKAYKTNDDEAVSTSTDKWVEDTTGMLGTGAIYGGTGTFKQFFTPTGPDNPLAYMLEVDLTADAVNSFKVMFRKWY